LLGIEAVQGTKRLSHFGFRFAEVLRELIEIFTVRSFPLPGQLTYGPCSGVRLLGISHGVDHLRFGLGLGWLATIIPQPLAAR
jgi:hypothetical protein